MRVLLSWLADYIEFTGKPRELARILTDVGLPVPKHDWQPTNTSALGSV